MVEWYWQGKTDRVTLPTTNTNTYWPGIDPRPQCWRPMDTALFSVTWHLNFIYNLHKLHFKLLIHVHTEGNAKYSWKKCAPQWRKPCTMHVLSPTVINQEHEMSLSISRMACYCVPHLLKANKTRAMRLFIKSKRTAATLTERSQCFL